MPLLPRLRTPIGLRGDAGMLKLPGMLGTPDASALTSTGSSSTYCCSIASTYAAHRLPCRCMAGCGVRSILKRLTCRSWETGDSQQ